jgi:hypothetical protein
LGGTRKRLLYVTGELQFEGGGIETLTRWCCTSGEMLLWYHNQWADMFVHKRIHSNEG